MREIAFETSPGEIRAVMFEAGTPVELHSFREGSAALGTVADARIISKSAGQTVLRLASDEDIILPATPAEAEGAGIRVEIIREGLSEPGYFKRAVARRSDAPLRVIDAATWRGSLRARAEREIAPDVGFDDHFAIAFEGCAQRGAARIWFERTKAGLVFDIDGSGAPAAINRDAAQEIARLLRLFQIGGAAIIDFVGMDCKAARLEIADVFDVVSAADPRRFERTAINGYGLMQVIRPKTGPSLLDRLFGRRRVSPSDETLALMLLRDASRAVGAGPRRCVTTPALAALLGQPHWQGLVSEAERLAGAPLDIVAAEGISGYGHIHVTQV
jgi:ribonuclease G